MSADALATALRVLGSAVSRGLVVDRPATVDVFAHGLERQEIRWLVQGMEGVTVDSMPATGKQRGAVEDMQIVGRIWAWPIRILLVGRDHPGLIGDLALERQDRAIKAHAAAAVSAP